MKKYISALGVESELPQKMTSDKIQLFLEDLREHPLKTSVQRLVVRTMKRAIYSGNNEGHYGLASEAYTHFTSPIRRYPDLIVHRLLKEYIHGAAYSENRIEYWKKHLPAVCKSCSQHERTANEAEWDLIALKKVDYISHHDSELYDVVVTNISKFGMFVEVSNMLIPGLIHISSLNDYFMYDENKNILIGERSKKIYRLGDILKVRVKDIDFVRGEVDFEIVQ